MNLWSELEQRVRAHGVRVEERLALLAELKADHDTDGTSVAERKDQLLSQIEDAARGVMKVLQG